MSKTGRTKLLATSEAEASFSWSNLLELQVAAYLPYELSFYASSSSWLAAHSVLDAGCGNGFFLSQLIKFFPDKTYTGLDISPQLISMAKANHALSNAVILQSDFFEFLPAKTFDVVVMRLIVQHMVGITAIFQQLDRLVQSAGSVFIVEPDTATFLNYPPTPKFQSLLAAYAEVAAKARLNRTNLANLADDLSTLRGWKVRDDRTLLAPAIGPFESSPLLQMFFLWIEIFERSDSVVFDFDDVRKELQAWAKKPNSFNQVGIRIIEVQRA